MEEKKRKLIKTMNSAGFTTSREEAERAADLWLILEPGLKVKENGRVETSGGDKTPLGLYRTLGGFFYTVPKPLKGGN